MSRHDPQVRLRHMLAYAKEAVTLMRDRRRADLDIDRALGLAVLRCVEIVGEAASRIPVVIRRRHPNIPWAQIIAMRNRLIHGYDIVDYDIVWSTVAQDLPPLIAELGEDTIAGAVAMQNVRDAHLSTRHLDLLRRWRGGIIVEHLRNPMKEKYFPLKGAKPADLPVQQATKFEFVVNLKAAKQIGLTLSPEFLTRANQVIK